LKKRNKKLLVEWVEAVSSGVLGAGRTTRIAATAIRKGLVVLFFRKEHLPLLSSFSGFYRHIS
jgi:hypothetical protein